MTTILKGKPVADQIYLNIKQELQNSSTKPCLVILIIGEDPSAEFYVSNLEKKGKRIGIEVNTQKLPADITQKELIKRINNLNQDSSVHGIMIQKPLPHAIDENIVVMKIDPRKDMDAFHPLNMGKLVLDLDGFIPSTPAAVLELMKYYEITTSGRNVVILGRSNIVGKPLANLLLRKNETGNATVTVCHSRTRELSKHIKKADILIAAIGKAEFVKADMIKKNCLIIDVGINQIETNENNSRFVGDVDYKSCFEKASMISPVPGGVGTVTTAMLLKNVLISFKNRR